MKANAYKLAKFLIGWPLSILALYFIWRIIAPGSENLIESVKHINASLLTAGVLCFVLFYFLRSFIWYKLLEEHAVNILYKQSSLLWAMSELKRYIPGNIWSYLGRAVVFSEKGVSKEDIGMLLIYEAQIFILSCLLISLLSLPLLFQFFFPGFSTISITIIVFLTLILVLGYIFNHGITASSQNPPPPPFNKGGVKHIPPFIKGDKGGFLPPYPAQSIMLLLFTSTIGLIFFGLGYYFIISSVIFLNPQLLPELIGFFCLSFLLGFLSLLTPAGLGIREGVVTLGLSKIALLSNAAFASIFARIILVISELIFICLSIIWLKIKSKRFVQIEKWIANHTQESILVCLYLLYTIYFTVTSFLRYDNFYTGRFDLGNMAQTVWNSSRGRFFLFTNPNGTDTVSRLAFHADFILVLLAPFYYIWSHPKILLLIQTVLVAAGAFFAYAIARDILKNKNLALVFSFLYLVNPSIERSNLYDFHAITLATFFLLGTYYFYRQRNYVFFSLFAFLAAITKEEVWVITALFGIFIFFFHGRRLLGSAVFFVSCAMFYFLIWQAIPQALGSGHFALSYYSDFGDSPGKIIRTTIFSPVKTITTILDPGRLRYLNQLFLPLGYLSIFSPLYLIFALPDLLINLLSNNTQLHQIYYQYTAAISPFIFITGILGLERLRKIIKLPSMFFIIYLLSASLISAYFFGPLPGALESNLDMYTRQVVEKKQIDEYLSGIRRRYSVAASNNVGSHLSQRQKIYTVPQGIGKADIIVFLLTDPSTIKSEQEMIQKLKLNNDYYLDLEQNEFIVFKKKGI